MSIPSGWELVLIVIVIMVLFGAKRLPDASRSLGRSLRIFKAETKGLRDDSDTTVPPAPIAPTTTPATSVVAEPVVDPVGEQARRTQP